MLGRVVYGIAVRVNEMFYYYSGVHLGIVLGLSEKYSPDYGVPKYRFRCVHRHLPVSMRCVVRECAAHPWDYAFVISLVVSDKQKFLFSAIINAMMIESALRCYKYDIIRYAIS